MELLYYALITAVIIAGVLLWREIVFMLLIVVMIVTGPHRFLGALLVAILDLIENPDYDSTAHNQ